MNFFGGGGGGDNLCIGCRVCMAIDAGWFLVCVVYCLDSGELEIRLVYAIIVLNSHVRGLYAPVLYPEQ
jgi:hypothetical protein